MVKNIYGFFFFSFRLEIKAFYNYLIKIRPFFFQSGAILFFFLIEKVLRSPHHLS
jgi:hypothetical protein